MAKSKVDFERLALLMSVVKDVQSVVPTMTQLSGAALREISEFNEIAKEEGAAVAKEAKEALAKAMAEAMPEPEVVEAPVARPHRLTDSIAQERRV